MAGAIRIVAVGRGRPGPYEELAAEYLARLARLAETRLVRVRSAQGRRAGDRRRDEASRLLEKIPERSRTVALDAGGAAPTSDSFRRRLGCWREAQDVTLIVGGPDGLDRELRERCDEVVSLGPMTLPHELALVVLLEQLYRALAADVGHPYARH